jgi:hypothetical protein
MLENAEKSDFGGLIYDFGGLIYDFEGLILGV